MQRLKVLNQAPKKLIQRLTAGAIRRPSDSISQVK
jgi:hypothetical protein